MDAADDALVRKHFAIGLSFYFQSQTFISFVLSITCPTPIPIVT
jgi:hypothetical protein